MRGGSCARGSWVVGASSPPCPPARAHAAHLCMAEETGEFDGAVDASSPYPARLPSSAEGVGEKPRLGTGGDMVDGEPARFEDSVGETPPPRAGPNRRPWKLPTSLDGNAAKVWSKPPPVIARDRAGEIGLKSVSER